MEESILLFHRDFKGSFHCEITSGQAVNEKKVQIKEEELTSTMTINKRHSWHTRVPEKFVCLKNLSNGKPVKDDIRKTLGSRLDSVKSGYSFCVRWKSSKGL